MVEYQIAMSKYNPLVFMFWHLILFAVSYVLIVKPSLLPAGSQFLIVLLLASFIAAKTSLWFGLLYLLTFNFLKICSVYTSELHEALTNTVISTISFVIIYRLLKDRAIQKKLSLEDELTGLSNRRSLYPVLNQLINSKNAIINGFTIMFIDIDFFKKVNDTYGHLIGDKVLNTAGLRFQSVLRPTDIAFRAGGDEFILVLPKLKRLSDIRRLASRIQQTISEPIVLENGTIFLTISCGIARFPKQATSARELIAKADDALYLAKEKGRNTIVLNKSVLVPKN